MNKLDDNFEKLKQSILEKRLKAEAVNKNVDINVDINTNKNVDKSVNRNVYKSDYINVDTNVDNNANNSDYKDVNKIVNNNVNKFVIKSNKDNETLVRYTLYLKPDTIEKISHYSKLLNLGKSELARKILEEILDNLEIV